MSRVKWSVFSLVCVTSLCVGVAQAEVINVNIISGNGPNQNQTLDGTDQSGAGRTVIDPEGMRWNDLNGAITSASLVTGQNHFPGIGVSRTSTGGNAQAGFVFSQTPGIDLTGPDIFDNYLAATNGFGPPLAGDVEFEFTGLNPNFTYEFHFVAVGDTPGQGATLTLGTETLSTTGTSPDGPVILGDNAVSFSPITGVTSVPLKLNVGPGNASFAAISGFQINIIPEPASFVLLGGGLLAMVALRRKK